MYKLLKLAFISLLMLCFSACREEDPIMPPEQQTAEKTIFVFMPYSNNLCRTGAFRLSAHCGRKVR